MLCLIIFISCITLAQNPVVDSLNALLTKTKNDSVRLDLLIKLSNECEPEDILKYSEAADKLSDTLLQQDPKQTYKDWLMDCKAKAFNNCAFTYFNNGDYPKCIEYYEKSLKITEASGNKKSISESLNNLGFTYNTQGNIPKALDCNARSLKIAEELGDKSAIAFSLNNLALIYESQDNDKKALEYFSRALKLSEELKDKKKIAYILNNIGSIYRSQNKLEKTLEYNFKSLKLFEELGDKNSYASLLANIGVIKNDQGKAGEALDYFTKAIAILNETGNKKAIGGTNAQMAAAYLKLAEMPENAAQKQKYNLLALTHATLALSISQKIGSIQSLKTSEGMVSKAEAAVGNYRSAYAHYKQFIIYRDSVNNETTRKASVKNELKYEFEKKEAVMKEQQDKERAVAEEKSRFQKIVIASVLAGLLLVIVFAAFVFRSLKTTKHQKIIIEEKQKEILDSIHYAKRIQTSLLPTEKYLEKNLRH